jgi:UDP-N-acetylglucosamine 3-dehydrogenase
VRVALVGAGTMGTVHAEAWRRLPGVELVAILARDPSPLPGRLGVAAVSSWEELLAHGPELVDVCVPTDLHPAFVLRAAAAGLHVVVEKPLALRLEDGRAMIAACAAAGVRLFVAHVVRFFPEYARARELVRAGAVGRVGVVRTFRGGGPPRGVDDWFADPARSGGPVLDLLIHDFDWLRWTLGEVRRVFCRVADGRHAIATLRCADGAIAEVTGSWAHPAGFHTAFEVAGSEGLLAHDSRRAAPLTLSLRRPADGGGGTAVPAAVAAQDPYTRELAHFLACLRDGGEPLVTAADALAALAVALAASASARSGLPCAPEVTEP